MIKSGFYISLTYLINSELNVRCERSSSLKLSKIYQRMDLTTIFLELAIRLQKQITEGLTELDRGEHYTPEEIKELMKIHKSGLKA